MRAPCWTEVPQTAPPQACPVPLPSTDAAPAGVRCMLGVCVSQGHSLLDSVTRSSGSNSAACTGQGQDSTHRLSQALYGSMLPTAPDRIHRHDSREHKWTVQCSAGGRAHSSPLGASSRSRTLLSWASRGRTVIMLLMLLPSCSTARQQAGQRQPSLVWTEMLTPVHIQSICCLSIGRIHDNAPSRLSCAVVCAGGGIPGRWGSHDLPPSAHPR